MITLTMSFDRLRDTLLWLCSVPPNFAAFVYDPNYGIYWVAGRQSDRLPLILAMRPGSFQIDVVQPIAVTAICFLASAFHLLIPQVRADHDLICTMDPLHNEYRIDVRSRDGVRFFSLIGLPIDEWNFGNIDYGFLLNELHLRHHGQTVSRNRMGNIVLHSLENLASIAFIFWGHHTIICCETGRVIIIQNPAPVGPEQPCICFLLSLYRDHVPDYRFERFSWVFPASGLPAVGTIRLSNDIDIYLLVRWNSFVRPEVRLIGF